MNLLLLTPEQISAMQQRVCVQGREPYVDLAVLAPFNGRIHRQKKACLAAIDHAHAWDLSVKAEDSYSSVVSKDTETSRPSIPCSLGSSGGKSDHKEEALPFGVSKPQSGEAPSLRRRVVQSKALSKPLSATARTVDHNNRPYNVPTTLSFEMVFSLRLLYLHEGSVIGKASVQYRSPSSLHWCCSLMSRCIPDTTTLEWKLEISLFAAVYLMPSLLSSRKLWEVLSLFWKCIGPRKTSIALYPKMKVWRPDRSRGRSRSRSRGPDLKRSRSR
eukprot:1323580-Amphidinium_carterae.1